MVKRIFVANKVFGICVKCEMSNCGISGMSAFLTCSLTAMRVITPLKKKKKTIFTFT